MSCSKQAEGYGCVMITCGKSRYAHGKSRYAHGISVTCRCIGDTAHAIMPSASVPCWPFRVDFAQLFLDIHLTFGSGLSSRDRRVIMHVLYSGTWIKLQRKAYLTPLSSNPRQADMTLVPRHDLGAQQVQSTKIFHFSIPVSIAKCS